MELREFDQADWDLFAGAVNPTVIGEFENESTGNSYVVIVDAYGLTLNRYDNKGYVDFVTIEMLPSQAELLAGSMEVDFDTFDRLIDKNHGKCPSREQYMTDLRNLKKLVD